DDLSRDQVVDGQSELPRQPTHATAEGESGDTGVAHEAARGRQAVGLGGVIPVAQGGSATDHGAPGDWVNGDFPHQAEIDHETVLDDAGAGGAMRSAAHGNLQVLAPRESDGGADVGSVRAADDHRRTPVDVSVPDDPSLLVARIAGLQHLSGYRCSQALDIRAQYLCHTLSLLACGAAPRRSRRMKFVSTRPPRRLLGQPAPDWPRR